MNPVLKAPVLSSCVTYQGKEDETEEWVLTVTSLQILLELSPNLPVHITECGLMTVEHYPLCVYVLLGCHRVSRHHTNSDMHIVQKWMFFKFMPNSYINVILKFLLLKL